ncbi:hypothetical protein CCACVL1_19514 [Corchorus capsularis]|uniref:Transposase n=1 Tax=Corchorus capsularis TaxID=210143 RepID=A0A1R3HGN7_COCAP|nr:hypothetical protein CCACVL1_19514 [Corchorus capsularis]
MLKETSLPHDPIFKGMYNVIHIDEKWFNLTKQSETYYLLPDEEDPLRTCTSKHFIGKVMFLVAIARPRFDAQGGTLETKSITKVDRDTMRTYLIGKVLPAIKEKWPREDLRSPIFIQQDNARPHIGKNDDAFCQAALKEGLDIQLTNQPPNSPDLNVLDLGFFSAIQSLHYQEAPRNIDELVAAIEKSFNDFPAGKSVILVEFVRRDVPPAQKVGLIAARTDRLRGQAAATAAKADKA